MNTKQSKTPSEKRKKWPFFLGGAIVLIAAAAVLIGGSRPSFAASLPQQSAVASVGSITTKVVGTGVLEYGDTLDINIPSELKIEEVFVKTGDYVQAGDVLASVSAASVKTQLNSIQDQLNDIDKSLNNKKNDVETTSVSSSLSGRVKAIFAAEGDSTADIMVSSGALMLISLDGNMAVDFESSAALSVGDKLSVVLSDGSEKSGSVKTASSGRYTVSLTDNGPKINDAVEIRAEDGSILGTGSLYISQPIAVTGHSGSIKSIHVSENQYVYSGTRLISLSDTGASAEYEQLLDERRELLETYSTLALISKTNTITAQESGTIKTVNIGDGSASTVSSSESSSQSPSSQYMNLASSGGGKFVNLSAVTQDVDQGGSIIKAISDINDLGLAAPVAGETPQTQISAGSYSGTVIWTPADSSFVSGTVYTAEIMLTANASSMFPAGFNPEITGAAISEVLINADTAGNTLTFKATYPAAGEAAATPPAGGNTGNNSNADNSTSFPSYSGGATYSAGSQSTSSSAADSSTGNITAFTIASGEKMSLSVSVDELDILSVAKGMQAILVFDAIEGEEFLGSISHVSGSSSNSSGLAKYTVEITIDADERMRSGMNATASIIVENKENILLIPVNAVQELGGRVFVYTSLDADGNLSGDTPIETGVSDGEYVEILSGLSEGDTVHYLMSTGTGSDFGGIVAFGNTGGPGMGGGQRPNFG